MDTIRTLIIDDEPVARERMRKLLTDEQDVEIIGECVDGAEAVAAINAESPDLVFLDIQMPYMDGFTALKAVEVTKMPVVVFVTAYDEFAIKAFEVNAIDYLLKPYDESRFRESLQRARRSIGERIGSGAVTKELRSLLEASPSKAVKSDRIAIRSSGQIRFLRASEIDWIDSQGNYARIHVGSETHMLKETLQNLEERLDASQFFRCHRSSIVNIDRIESLEKWFQGDYVITLHSGEKIPLSRRRYTELREIMKL